MKLWFTFLRAERAVIAATTAVLMPALILFIALAVEVGDWYAVDRQMQSAADAAAVAAALELANGGSLINENGGTIASATTKAGYSASRNGFSPAVTINCPPSMGAYAGQPCASPWSSPAPTVCCTTEPAEYVEAIVSRQQPTIFANLFTSSVTVGARAVASVSQPYQSCGLALATNVTPPAVLVGTGIPTVIGTPTSITLGTGCVLASDSTAATSLDELGARVTAPTLISAGGVKGTCFSCTTPPTVDGPVTLDPLSCLLSANTSFCSAVKSPPSCTIMSISSTGTVSNAGTVCFTSMSFELASFTASISGTTMTVTSAPMNSAGSGAALSVGEAVTDAGGLVTPGTVVTAAGTGTGGTGTYTVSVSQIVASESMSAQLTTPQLQNLNLQSGTYYDQGEFNVPLGAILTGSGVTMILLNPINAAVCGIAFGQNSISTLTGPNSGTFAGMLFVQGLDQGSQPASCASPNSIVSGATATFAGRIYSPNAAWNFDASTMTTTSLVGGNGNKCLTVIANSLVFGSTVDLEQVGCTGPSGTDFFNIQSISLVE